MSSNVHLALDGDVRVRHAGGEELAEGTQEESHERGDLAPLLDGVLHLLKESVLKNGVDDEDQRRDDAGEESLGSLVLEERHEGADGAGGFGRTGIDTSLDVSLLVLLASCDTGVDDPDWVRDDDCGGSSEGTSQHGLDGGEFAAGAASFDSSLLKEGSGPLIPVVVDEVGDADAEKGRVNARVETRDTLTCDDTLNGVEEFRLGLLRLDLSTSRESD